VAAPAPAADGADLLRGAGEGGKSGLPPELLAKLATDPDRDARQVAAASPETIPATLAALASDSETGVRTAVARNPATPQAALDQLLKDSSDDVRAAVVDGGRASVDALALAMQAERDSDVLEACERRGDLDAEILAALSMNEYYRARLIAASHPRTSDDTLVRLAADTDSDVVEKVLARDALPGEAVAILARSDNERVSSTAKARAEYAPIQAASRRRWLIGGAVLLVVLLCAGTVGSVIALAVGGFEAATHAHHGRW